MDENQYRQWLDVSDSKFEETDEFDRTTYDDAGYNVRHSDDKLTERKRKPK